MARVVWKGAISFGLVQVPVVLHPGARRADLDFDWIDHRDMAPVGYQRINKRTGKPIASEHIVKGYQYEKGEYVLMGDEDFHQANPTAAQTVEIDCFVKSRELPPYHFDTPYYMVPDKRGAKGYALLRETLRRTDRVGIANVVLHNKQHLAAVMVVGDMLVLNTMRYADEIMSQEGLEVPPADLEASGISAREADMALRLVDDMTEKWRPERFHDAYREDLLARIESKIEAGQIHELAEPQEAVKATSGAKVIDLMSMLRQSIESRAPGRTESRGSRKRGNDDAREASAADETDGKTAARKSTARKPAARTGAASRTASATAKVKPAARTATSTRKTASKTAGGPARKSGSRRAA
jgi:DNA end-binding protein Ku